MLFLMTCITSGIGTLLTRLLTSKLTCLRSVFDGFQCTRESSCKSSKLFLHDFNSYTSYCYLLCCRWQWMCTLVSIAPSWLPCRQSIGRQSHSNHCIILSSSIDKVHQVSIISQTVWFTIISGEQYNVYSVVLSHHVELYNLNFSELYLIY